MKYLGKKDARGLWGIKHTRKPVDDMVGLARGLGPGAPLPYLQLSVSHRGVLVTPHKNNTCHTMDCGLYPIDTISYGVQDLVYTRVFAMIIVKVSLKYFDPTLLNMPSHWKETIKAKDKASYGCHGPFQCHAFICDSRQSARHLTFALATAFKVRKIQATNDFFWRLVGLIVSSGVLHISIINMCFRSSLNQSKQAICQNLRGLQLTWEVQESWKKIWMISQTLKLEHACTVIFQCTSFNTYFHHS